MGTTKYSGYHHLPDLYLTPLTEPTLTSQNAGTIEEKIVLSRAAAEYAAGAVCFASDAAAQSSAVRWLLTVGGPPIEDQNDHMRMKRKQQSTFFVDSAQTSPVLAIELDSTEVSIGEFGAFVAATGTITTAEKSGGMVREVLVTVRHWRQPC